MPRRARRARCIALLISLLPLVVTGVAAGAPGPLQEADSEPRGALPYDLAFDRHTFPYDEAPAVAPGGGMVAYSVIEPRADVNTDARYDSNGTPSSAIGSRIYLSETAGGDATGICPAGGNCWRPSWSPDGSMLAFFSDAEGMPQLWVYELDSGAARRVARARLKPKLWSGDEARWSPDGETLYVGLDPVQEPDVDRSTLNGGATGTGRAAAADARVTVLRSGSEAEDDAAAAPERPQQDFMMLENNAELAAVDLASGQVRVLVPATSEPRPSVLRLSPSGRWISYLSVFQTSEVTSQQTFYDLGLVPSSGGDVVTVAAGLPVGRDYHRQNYRWHPSEDRLVFLQDGGLHLVELPESGPSVPRRLGADLGDLAPEPLTFTADGTGVVVGIDPHDYQDYMEEQPRGLAVVPLDGSPPTRIGLPEQGRYVQLLRAGERTAWQPGPATLVALVRSAGGESCALRLSYGDEPGGAESLWCSTGRLGGFTSGGVHDSIIAVYEDAGTPPDVFRFDAALANRERISNIDDRLEVVARPTVQIIETEVPLHDGTIGRLRTAIVLPPGAERGDRLPAIVMHYPGGDVSRHAERYGGGDTVSVPTLLFVSRGYAVMLVELRLGPNAEAGNPLREMVDVLLPQVYHAAQLGYVDAARLGIVGQSFGGYGTAGIVSGTNLFRAAVAISGIYDLAGTYGHLGEGNSSFWIGWSEGGQACMGTHPWGDLRRYLDNSPYYQADRIHTPLLIVHGDQDTAFHDAQKLFSALRRLDRTSQLAIYHGQGHVVSNWDRDSAIDACRRTVAFFDRHLRGR